MISDDRQSITLRLKNGKTTTQRIVPTPKANLENLQDDLTRLLSTPDAPKIVESPNKKKKDTPEVSFGTIEWHLDPLGDAIHRHTAHSWAGDCDILEKLIMKQADKMNHHPHITRGKSEDGEDKYMTITCTTHSPRGLGVRDTRLAKQINQILAAFDAIEPVNPENWLQDLDKVKAKVVSQRERMVAMNRDKISRALESCACDTKKSQSATSPPTASTPSKATANDSAERK